MATCPSCKEPMMIYEWKGVEVDHCLQCHGTWLDTGELEHIFDLEATAAAGGISAILSHAGKSTAGGSRNCPRCAAKLRIEHVGKAPPVEIDICPRGHGLWFDRGEIRQMIAEFSGGEEAAAAHFFEEIFSDDLKTP